MCARARVYAWTCVGERACVYVHVCIYVCIYVHIILVDYVCRRIFVLSAFATSTKTGHIRERLFWSPTFETPHHSSEYVQLGDC